MPTHEKVLPAITPAAPSRKPIVYTGGIPLRESLRIAIATLSSNKVRSALTALGVIIGVAAVVVLMALGRGAQEQITQQLTANGANLLTIIPGSIGTGGFSSSGNAQTLSLEDAQALSDPSNAPDIALVSPESMNFGRLAVGSVNTSGRVYGATETYMSIHNDRLRQGEFISANDVRRMANVAVLGSRVAATLFPSADPVGQYVRINGQRFRVIGILEYKGGGGFVSVDDSAIIPITTAQRRLFGAETTASGDLAVSSIAVQARSQESIQRAQNQIVATLRQRHQLSQQAPNDFTINNQQDLINTLVASRQTMTMYLGAIASISLLVGGIGIMNIMLVSVRERTHEIGLRKAIGARERDILTQFLIEALLLSIGGGLIGLLTGILMTVGITATGRGNAIISPLSMVLAVGVSAAIGLFFGITPAQRAAQLDPIEALRHD